MTEEALHPRIAPDACPHRDLLDESISSDMEACELCGETDHTRICMTCGAVTCCESQEGHDTDHYDETGHPFIRPYRESYDFLWCYECEAFLQE